VAPVTKKNGDLRFCIDYHCLNALNTVQNKLDLFKKIPQKKIKCKSTKHAHEMAQLKHELAAVKTEIDSLYEWVSPRRQPSAEETQTLVSLRAQLTAQTIKTIALVTARDSLKIEVINLKALLRERAPKSSTGPKPMEIFSSTSGACPLVPSEPQEHLLKTETGLAFKSGAILTDRRFT
jgi:tRNA U34 5-carboxymethylaminomethyl modifying GTPase MnmE/TrmE